MLGGGGVSHPLQLTTGLVIKSITTSPTLAGEHMLFILQVSILSEQTKNFPKGKSSEHTSVLVERTGNYEERPLCAVGVWRTVNYRLMAQLPTPISVMGGGFFESPLR